MKGWALWWLVGVAVLVVLELTLRGVVGPYNYQILGLIGINIILAVSLNLINGYTGQFSIGHAGFYAVGAYTCAAVVVYGGEAIRGALPFFPALAQDAVLLFLGLGAAAVVTAVAGLAVGIPSLRLRGDYLAIVTLGFGEIIRVVVLNVDSIGGARGFAGIPQLANFFWIYLFVLVTIVVIHNLVHSGFGRAFVSIRDDEIAAEAMGVDTTRYKILSFVISSMFAGIAGGLFGHFTMYLHPNSFTFLASFYVIIMIVVGGLGSIEGAILGAILVTAGLEVLRGLGPFRLVTFAALLVLVMIYRPRGILGSWTLFGRKSGAKARPR